MKEWQLEILRLTIMKISSINGQVEQGSETTTKTSFFIRFLIRICYLAVSLNDDKITFNFCKTIVYIILNICWILILPFVQQMLGLIDIGAQFMEEVYWRCEWRSHQLLFQRGLLEIITWITTMNLTILGSLFPILLRKCVSITTM